MNPAPASVAAAWLRPMLCRVTPSWARCRYTWVSCSPQNPPNTVNTARNLAVKIVKKDGEESEECCLKDNCCVPLYVPGAQEGPDAAPH